MKSSFAKPDLADPELSGQFRKLFLLLEKSWLHWAGFGSRRSEKSDSDPFKYSLDPQHCCFVMIDVKFFSGPRCSSGTCNKRSGIILTKNSE
jgi:hypothetical protein